MEEMRCASMELAASLDSSKDHKPMDRILSCLHHSSQYMHSTREREGERERAKEPTELNLHKPQPKTNKPPHQDMSDPPIFDVCFPKVGGQVITQRS
jgi:hypothetical protein